MKLEKSVAMTQLSIDKNWKIWNHIRVEMP